MLLRVDIDSASSVSIRTIHIRIIEEWTYKAFAPYRSYSYPAPISDSRFSARDLVSFKEAAIIRPHDSDRYERRIRLPALQSSYASSITLHKFYLQVIIVLNMTTIQMFRSPYPLVESAALRSVDGCPSTLAPCR